MLSIRETDMRYIGISNADGKVWVLPCSYISTGLLLYHPSSLKGKLLKTFLPYIHNIKCVKDILKIRHVENPVDKSVVQYLQTVFKDRNIILAFFLGTPCKNQKMTIQVSKKTGELLGYCKLSNDENVSLLFRREKQLLRYLHERGVQNIPMCLDYDRLGNGYYTFVQTTIKSKHSKIVHRLTNMHVEVIKSFNEKTEVKTTYRETDYFSLINELEENISKFRKRERIILLDAKKLIDDYYEPQTLWYAYHGDFTPWNCFIEGQSLFTFDFEYAKYTCPKYMDLIHYLSQIAHLEKHMHSKEMYNYIIHKTNVFPEDITDFRMLYLSYMLYQFAFYSKMFNWNFPTTDSGYICWIGQIKLLLNNYRI